jgi:hypothetical protein
MLPALGSLHWPPVEWLADRLINDVSHLTEANTPLVAEVALLS